MDEIKKLSQSIKIIGNIKGVMDLNQIKQTIESYRLSNGDKFTIEIIDSFAMPSAMIGYLLKMVEQDKVKLSLHIHDKRLVELLDDLGLMEVFNIQQALSA